MRTTCGFTGALLTLWLAISGTPAVANEFRALWVDAWGVGFFNSSQVDQLISDCRAYNFNAIIVQMRRRGDAFYNYTINDPKTTAIAADYDALQDLLNKAHAGSPRIEVHCWVITFPIWGSLTPPSQAGHVLNLHPEYLMQDSSGGNYLSGEYYLDPGHPDATYWNFMMATNIVRRYNVDGFHWDYIRYPGQDAGYNPTALARYNAESGLSGAPSPSDIQFSNWRRRQVTDFLRWVNAELLAIRPSVQLSCSVFGSRTDAYNARFQDWAAWNNEGIVDFCAPMDYTSDNGLMQSRVDDAYANQGVRRVYIGQAGYMNTKENTVTQLLYIRGKPLYGFTIFDYGQPSSLDDRYTTLDYIKNNFQPTWDSTPVLPWKATPTTAILRGTVKRQDTGAAVYNATVTIAPLGRTQRTEPHGAFAFFETTPGAYSVSATAADLGTFTTNLTLVAGTNRAVTLLLPPDPTPPVISAVSVSALTDTSATINWTTDEVSDSAVDYGTTTAYGATVSNAAKSVSHSLSLAGLAPNTTYHYRLRSRNNTGLQAISGDYSFITNPAGVISDIIVDDNDAEISSGWIVSSYTGFYGGYRYNGPGSGAEWVAFRPDILRAGNYKVYVGYVQGSNRSTDSPHTVNYNGGSQTFYVNQQINGSQWLLLGTFNFAAGTAGTVEVTDEVASGNVIVDAVKFEYVPPPAPPAITAQPAGRSVNRGGSTTFTVTATGAAPLSYGWRFNGTRLSGATVSSYAVNNAQSTNEGEYSVVVTNVAGAVTSNPAYLIVNIPPAMGGQPQSLTVRQGADATFTVTASGTEPLGYQWRFNSANLAGATSSSYTRANAQTNHGGNYSVIVSNVAGSVTSVNALLTVALPQRPRFQSISLLPDKGIRLTLTGDTGVVYAIDVSSNLTGWSALTSGMLTVSPLEVLDPSASNASTRFYRARQ